jgi:hypothetical protein
VRLGEDPDVGQLDPVGGGQPAGRQEQRGDLRLGRVGVRHVDPEALRVQATAGAEHHGGIEFGPVLQHPRSPSWLS